MRIVVSKAIMNRNLKRKRRSSTSSQEDEDYAFQEKKGRHEEVTQGFSNTEIGFAFKQFDKLKLISEPDCRSPASSFLAQEDDVPVQIYHSDVFEQEVMTSECECDTCTQGHSDAAEILSPLSHRSSDMGLRLETSETELPHHSNSPVSHHGYSSCDERVLNSDFISSPVAASIVDSDLDLENDDDDDDDDDLHEVHSQDDVFDDLDHCDNVSELDNENQDDKLCEKNKVISFMGQLTPGSSVGKGRTDTSWTSGLVLRDESFASESKCPVPPLSWASREKFWEMMCRKDELSLKVRNPDLFDYQQHLKPRMRIILLDWISEVAAVFKLHRETYYLTIDYIDRYLSCVPDIPKTQLQLIGVTCLVLASKMEEIYPPKIDQFANVTDGACTEQEIFSMEVTIMTHLNWVLSPITVNNWLEMMLQFIYQKLGKNKDNNIFTPQFSSSLFKKLCQLLDLVTLDITSLRFSYCVLAAAAIHILVDPNLAISISGLKKEVLEPCVQWMSVYWKVLRETNVAEMENVEDLLNDKNEIYFGNQRPELQTHDISMQLYELVQAEFEEIERRRDLLVNNSQILTPPPSSSKSSSAYLNDPNEA